MKHKYYECECKLQGCADCRFIHGEGWHVELDPILESPLPELKCGDLRTVRHKHAMNQEIKRRNQEIKLLASPLWYWQDVPHVGEWRGCWSTFDEYDCVTVAEFLNGESLCS